MKFLTPLSSALLLASRTHACLQASIYYEHVTATITAAEIWENDVSICHLGPDANRNPNTFGGVKLECGSLNGEQWQATIHPPSFDFAPVTITHGLFTSTFNTESINPLNTLPGGVDILGPLNRIENGQPTSILPPVHYLAFIWGCPVDSYGIIEIHSNRVRSVAAAPPAAPTTRQSAGPPAAPTTTAPPPPAEPTATNPFSDIKLGSAGGGRVDYPKLGSAEGGRVDYGKRKLVRREFRG